METPRYEAEGRIAETLAAASFVLVAGLLLWPPEAVYWEGVTAVGGDRATHVLVGAIATGVGVWFARTSGLALPHLFVGGVGASLAGMAAVVGLQLQETVSFTWYGLLLGCILGGALTWTGVRRFVGGG